MQLQGAHTALANHKVYNHTHLFLHHSAQVSNSWLIAEQILPVRITALCIILWTCRFFLVLFACYLSCQIRWQLVTLVRTHSTSVLSTTQAHLEALEHLAVSMYVSLWMGSASHNQPTCKGTLQCWGKSPRSSKEGSRDMRMWYSWAIHTNLPYTHNCLHLLQPASARERPMLQSLGSGFTYSISRQVDTLPYGFTPAEYKQGFKINKKLIKWDTTDLTGEDPKRIL